MSAGDLAAWRLGAFYFVYFSAMGAMLPYWSLYLQDRGLEPRTIGALAALVTVIKVASPNFWGWVADTRGWRVGVIRLTLLAATLAFAGILLPGGAWWVALVVGTYAFFWQGALPQFEALTLSRLGDSAPGYGRIRLWGSIGFIVAVTGCGWVLDRAGAGAVPAVVVPLMALTCAASLLVPAPPAGGRRERPAALGRTLATPAVAGFLLACALMQAAHGPFHVFFSIHLEEAGYSRERIGQLWAVGVLAEIAVFVWLSALVRRYGLRRLFVACFVASTVRWVLVAQLTHSVAWLVAAQLLHAVTFGVYHASAVQLVAHYFPGSLQGRGQALYASVGFGLGGGLGSLASGYAWELLGPRATWLAAAALSVAGGLVALAWVAGPPRDGASAGASASRR